MSTVEVSPYDPQWPERFATEHAMNRTFTAVVLMSLLVCGASRETPVGSRRAGSLALVQSRGIQGRWGIVGLPMAYHFIGDSVEVMMPPPQASGQSYRVLADSVELSTHSPAPARSMAAFSVRNDTLELTSGGRTKRYHRIGASPGATPGIGGSWRLARSESPGMTSPEVLTFRSDGELITEVGIAARVHGDTIELTTQGQTVRSLVRRSGEALTVTPLTARPARGRGPAPTQALVPRAWGCFGFAPLDKSARECQGAR
jgi:hypothetical protein